ncbi:hypothetical protein [Thalassolituus oleivorans]|uniref:hypothetical protein n=1 Tax=Thalassolituus oleivorans TaxID=187493 RepID=UPI0023F25F14|nr:hypothetical protein [Thalassolituus oleivorans]
MIRKIGAFKFIIFLMLAFLALVVSFFMQEKEVVIPMEGDVVTWRFSPDLITRARLGQRRKHVVIHPEIDNLFYEPEYERFLGQFPIDYIPEQFPAFTVEEAAFFLKQYGEKKHARKSLHPIEFNLMLDGDVSEATDRWGELDSQNQIKIYLVYNRLKVALILAESNVVNKSYNSQDFFENELVDELNLSSKEKINGLDCYLFKDGRGGKRCFGYSRNSSASGFYFYVPVNPESSVLVYSQQTIYGGIEIQWFVSQSNMYRAIEIDAEIWRLLDVWNISPAKK